MAERKKPALTDILAEFRKAAEEANIPDPEDIEEIEEVEVCDPESGECDETTAEDVAEAAQNVEDAEDELVDAKDALEAVADDFINEHTAALQKEAMVFGRLFASSCLEQMNKTAALQQMQQNAYATTMGAMEGNMNFSKQAALYEATYLTTMAKLAGFEDEEEMAQALGVDQVSPEDAAALAQQAQAEPDYEDEGDYYEGEDDDQTPGEELADLTDDLGVNGREDHESIAEALQNAAEAANSNASAIEEIAEAARILSDHRHDDYEVEEGHENHGEEDIDPEEIAQQAADEAYQNTLQALSGE